MCSIWLLGSLTRRSQYAPVRTSVWMKDGVKSRLRKLTGKSSRAQTVETEA